jgi:hypothetical protein
VISTTILSVSRSRKSLFDERFAPASAMIDRRRFR